MMYVSTKLREPTGLIYPKGPSFSKSKITSSDIGGTLINFRAPKHRPIRSSIKQTEPGKNYNTQGMIFRSTYNKYFHVSDNWKSFEFFHRSWAFNGPWFTGAVANLRMHFNLIKPVNFENMDFSLFHPRAFENVIAEYLTNSYSKRIDEESGKHHFITPIEWTPLNHLPVNAVRLQVIPDETVRRETISHFVFFPISNEVMAVIHFIPSQINAATQAENDKRVSRKPMYDLMDQIINSIELKLSPEAEAQQKKAFEGLDDTSLVKEFAPLKWSRDSEVELLEEQKNALLP